MHEMEDPRNFESVSQIADYYTHADCKGDATKSIADALGLSSFKYDPVESVTVEYASHALE